MRYDDLKRRPEKEFKRLTGVRPGTFELLVSAWKESLKDRWQSGENRGRKRSLEPEDEVLLTLMYWREYRSYLHISTSYGISEPTVSRIIRDVEDCWTKRPELQLPGKRSLVEDVEETLLVDVTEIAIERPKKDRESTTVEKRSGIRSSARSSWVKLPDKSMRLISSGEDSMI
jgi:Helix-turn-helix of DDE superfamily endonuclease